MTKAAKEGLIYSVIFLVIGIYFFAPALGEYKLKPGRVACPSKQAVVEHRGARMMGLWAQARVVSYRKCVSGPQTFSVTRRSTWLDLPYKINLGGRVMYADHDAIEKI